MGQILEQPMGSGSIEGCFLPHNWVYVKFELGFGL